MIIIIQFFRWSKFVYTWTPNARETTRSPIRAHARIRYEHYRRFDFQTEIATQEIH